MTSSSDPRVDADIDELPDWQQAIGWEVRSCCQPGPHPRRPVASTSTIGGPDHSAMVSTASGTRARSTRVEFFASSTGKTRACWEAIQVLSDRWWLWHPIDPSRPDAAAEALGEVGPYTVVWLNETQHYLLTPDRALGERVAAGLRTLLRDPNRRPVLILATVWPQYWATLTTPPPAGAPDPHGQARELLAGADIPVPDTFSNADLQALRAATVGDPRLRHAAKYAQAGRITQQLAGVPELIARYRNAPAAARAIIEVAIDARRLGHPPEPPRDVPIDCQGS